jgi:predicted transcriptional regulator
MRRTDDAVDGNATVSDVLDLYAIGPRLRSQPVAMDGRVVGVIGQDEIDSVAPSRWPSVRARSLMSKIGPADVVEADAPLESLLLRPSGVSGRAVVVEEGTVVGIIDGQALAQVLST